MLGDQSHIPAEIALLEPPPRRAGTAPARSPPAPRRSPRRPPAARTSARSCSAARPRPRSCRRRAPPSPPSAHPRASPARPPRPRNPPPGRRSSSTYRPPPPPAPPDPPAPSAPPARGPGPPRRLGGPAPADPPAPGGGAPSPARSGPSARRTSQHAHRPYAGTRAHPPPRDHSAASRTPGAETPLHPHPTRPTDAVGAHGKRHGAGTRARASRPSRLASSTARGAAGYGEPAGMEVTIGRVTLRTPTGRGALHPLPRTCRGRHEVHVKIFRLPPALPRRPHAADGARARPRQSEADARQCERARRRRAARAPGSAPASGHHHRCP